MSPGRLFRDFTDKQFVIKIAKKSLETIALQPLSTPIDPIKPNMKTNAERHENSETE
jgi:hypothetical protein